MAEKEIKTVEDLIEAIEKSNEGIGIDGKGDKEVEVE